MFTVLLMGLFKTIKKARSQVIHWWYSGVLSGYCLNFFLQDDIIKVACVLNLLEIMSRLSTVGITAMFSSPMINASPLVFIPNKLPLVFLQTEKAPCVLEDLFLERWLCSCACLGHQM